MTEEQSSPDASETLSPIEKLAMKDYYLSYKFSQGSEQLQHRLMLYGIHNTPHTDLEQLVSGGSTVTMALSKLRPPRQHIDLTGGELSGTFNVLWEKQMDISRTVLDPTIQLESLEADWDVDEYRRFIDTFNNPEIQLQGITRDMLDRDMLYQSVPRPSRVATSDEHESYVRTYAILRTPTGSQLYDKLFGEIREIMASVYTVQNGLQNSQEAPLGLSPTSKALSLKVNSLANMWREKHGERVYFEGM